MMISDGEQDARRMLNYCKNHAKEALAALDPAPAEPVTKAILALIDAADHAAVELQKRTAAEKPEEVAK